MNHRPRTERRHRRTRELDRLSIPELVKVVNREDARVPAAVGRRAAAIARAIRLIVSRLEGGGRLWLVGAGTSGRLAVLEAAECPPTFGTPASLVRAVIAGGRRAVIRSVEGAEDDAGAGARALKGVRAQDAVMGIAASGVTPFVRGALEAARRAGAARLFLSCSPVGAHQADVRITLDVGAEVIAGSTRLKAGTATKLVLNMITVGVMARLGRVHENLMVDVQPTNAKLRARARRIVLELTGASPSAVRCALRQTDGRVKAAVVMLRRGCTAREAERILRRCGGFLRKALEHE
ncbi:MAG: N-acetylmuramic acid 6-phosphate etherase [Planctomycetes bacterium]|nr:N-acetylmuramic acid 6-phosphate etherase [Planctomycetota bacterium]